MANYVTPTSDKKKSTALILCLFGGAFGLHRFYVGKFGTGFIYACSMGLFFIGYFIDLFSILNGTFRDNVGMPLRN